MRKLSNSLVCLLLILTVFFPVATLVSACFGYVFTLANVSVFSVMLAIIFLCVLIMDVAQKRIIDDKNISVLLPILTPLSCINAFFLILECGKIWVVASTVVCIGCSFFLTIKYGKPLALRIVAIIISGLMLLSLGFFSFLRMTFGNIGKNTVVQTLSSPNGSCYAQVVDSDQGALGGDTVVYVYQKKKLDLFLFKIEKKPQIVFIGAWGEYKDLQMHWKDDSHLVINSTEYTID